MRKLPKYSLMDEDAARCARSRSGLLVGVAGGIAGQQRLDRRHGARAGGALGTVAIRLMPARCSSDSCATKKKSLSFSMGPPSEPPNWFKRSGVLLRAVEEVAGVERAVAEILEEAAVERRCRRTC